MLPSLELICKLMKIKSGSVSVDNVVFKLHYKLTASMLLSFAVLLSLKQFAGTPILCMIDGSVSENLINDYCWVNPTFTLPRKVHGKIGERQIAPGVADSSYGEEGQQFQTYYQWVFFVLFFQAAAFCLPRYIWKACEGDFMKALSTGINFPTVETELKEKRLLQIQGCFLRHRHGVYVTRFLICEALNLGNVLSQIWFLDYFVDGEFIKHGWVEVFKFTEMTDASSRDDAISVVFPKMAKCPFLQYGPSGGITKLEALCVLPLNVMNEKILVFSWLWFSLLAVLTAVCLVYRIATLVSKYLRYCVLSSRSRTSDRTAIRKLSRRLDFGDWFVLYQLGKNVYPEWFDELVISLAERIDRDESK